MNINTMKENVEKEKEWLINVRRDFHKHPELGQEEFRTMEKICEYLQEMGISYRNKVFKTGVIAEIKGEDQGYTIALRADIDALPIIDKKNTSYASINEGKCHACGHDAHTTIAKYFSANKIVPPCNIRFLFQPAEETVGGAKPMIQEGALENVNCVFGLHVDEYLPTGHIGIKYGAMNASSDTLKINIYGKSCHGAYPSGGVDAILAASHVMVALQSIVSRNIDARESGVVTIGTIHGGTQGNIIADKVQLVGTLRTLNPEVRKTMLGKIEEIVINVPKAFGGSGEFVREEGYTALINHDKEVDIVKENAVELLGEDNIFEKKTANMGVEDFAYFIENIPGAFFTLGVANKEKGIDAPAHNGLFDIDEDALLVGVEMQLLNIYSAFNKK
ncbi:M20 family metallopeptidase [Fusobacterium ulcerans]|uniref:M20 metallopeptidase family protein n=1 Tax=Fusobacterium ulcerans TaxID=861 RepID=UPI0026F33488|nr:amidohydrolase [Fusobacterium ulcerans]